MKTKETKFIHGLLTLALLTVVMFVSVVVFKAEVQIPMAIGCVIAGLVAVSIGYSWEEIMEAIIKSVGQSLEAILILMSIGILVAVWIASGTVPTIIYYGLKIVSPKFFLLAAFILCSLVSMITGAWGAAGTVGLAFAGIGQVLGVDAGMIGGAIVAGAYVGDKLSPFSDGTNVAAAVAKTNVFTMLKQMFKIAPFVWGISAIAYAVLGMQYRNADQSAIDTTLHPVMDKLAETFGVGLLAMLPLAVMLICVALKMPSLPAILTGVVVGAVQGCLTQKIAPATMFHYASGGYISQTGNTLLDTLLTAGGLSSMMNTVALVLIAMSFGGIMQGTGQMDALAKPIVSRVRSTPSLFALTMLSCLGVNILLPDQYLALALPGQMYGEEYRRRGIDGPILGNVLGAGGAVTSPLVPWNSCGMYMSTVLGVSTLRYLPFAVFNYLMPVGMFILALGMQRKRKMV